MPDFSSHASDFRASGYSTRVYLSAFVPAAPVATGTIVGVPGDPRFLLIVSYSTGAFTDVQRGMEVVITDPSGNFKGRTHVAFSTPDNGPLTSVLLPVRELSLGTINVQANDLFAIYDEYRLHDKLVAANQYFWPDYATYGYGGVSLNLHPPPLANSGGHWAGWVDGYGTSSVSTTATVHMTGSTSIPVDPANISGLTHLWVLPSGVAFHAGSAATDADPVLDVSPGQYVVDHTVTDADSSVSITQHVVLICCDAAHPPYEIMLTADLQADENHQWHYTVRLFQAATLDDLPDGALVILWAQERINGSWQSIRNNVTGRENILAVGYLHNDKSTLDQPINTVTFDVVSIAQRLDEIAGYSKAMNETATPDAWNEINTLTTMRAKIQLLMFYTTVIESGFDIRFDSTYVNYVYPTLYCQRSTPLQQVRELAHSTDARMMVLRTGQINIHLHPAYVPIGSRSGITVMFNISSQDVIHAEFTRSHVDTVELMKVSGFSAGSSNLPYFSLYPGNAPGEATQAPTYERLILNASTPQADINARAGRYGAYVDQVFIDENHNSQKYRIGQLILILRGSYDFFDYYCAYLQLSLDGSSNLRGFDLSKILWYVQGVQLTYGGGTAQVKVTLNPATNAAPGTSYFPPPSASLPPITSPTLPPLTTPTPTSTGTGLLPGALTLYAFDSTNACVWAYDKTTGTWTNAINLTGLGMSGTLVDACWRVGGNQARILTSTEVRTLNNYASGTPALGTAHTFPETTTNRQFNFERGEIDWGIITSEVPTNPVQVDYTTDNLATVTRATPPTSAHELDASNPVTGVWLDPHQAGHGLISVYTTTGSSGSTLVCTLYETFDHGATWASKGISAGRFLANMIQVGYLDLSASTIYHGVCDGTSGSNVLFKLYRNGTDISPQVSGTPYGYAQLYNRCVGVADDDLNSVLAIGAHESNVSTMGLFLSRNAGTTWTTVRTPSSGMAYRSIYFVNRNYAYLIGVGGAVGVWTPTSGIVDMSIPSGGDLRALMGA